LNEAELAKEFVDKTPNWDSDRIAEVDTIILKWLFVSFEIPIYTCESDTKRIFRTCQGVFTKSSIFINGILDNLVKELEISKN
jgi:N utilization substance protein B